MGAKDNFFYPKKTLKIRGNILDLTYPKVMGIVNITPDSFYKGSRFKGEMEILGQVEAMIDEGVDIADLGAYSSRPGAENISEKEELKRLRIGVEAIRKSFPEVLISVDTFRSKIAKYAFEEGADIINDISGGEADKNMFKTIAELNIPYILMHMRGNPANMTTMTDYEDLLYEMLRYFEIKIQKLYALGHNDIIVDPGIGFSKTVDQNYEILKNLDYFKVLKLPLLIGVSRKSMIYRKFGSTPEEALNGTSVLNTIALQKGASFLRVHDVKEAREVVELIKLVSR